MKLTRIVFSLLLFTSVTAVAQQSITKDIKSFGAKGDGKTNDHAAFQKAADFFNKRGGNGTLVISKGIYIVGKQEFTNGTNDRFGWHGEDLLHFTGVKNLVIKGTGATIKYADNLRFGSFDPGTGQPYKAPGYFTNKLYGATLGHCIFIDAGENVTITGVELNGNKEKVILGGSYGDVGRQLPHYGIFIQNSRSITVDKVNLHHFALDGICVANKKAALPDKIKLLNSAFENNARQGFSWIGGNDLYAKNCKFNFTGSGKFASAPGAGIDVEAEYGPIRNGVFENCESIDNNGCAIVADSGDSGDCSFTGCTFWGLNTWSIWVNKPGYTFTKCNIYGSIVHGYDAATDKEATKFASCYFEDKPYKGKEAFGQFLIETNNKRRMSFSDCKFVSNTKKICWISCPANWAPEEKYQVTNCLFYMRNNNFPQGDYLAVVRGIRQKNITWIYDNRVSKQKGYYLNACCENYNVDLGGCSVKYTYN